MTKDNYKKVREAIKRNGYNKDSFKSFRFTQEMNTNTSSVSFPSQKKETSKEQK